MKISRQWTAALLAGALLLCAAGCKKTEEPSSSSQAVGQQFAVDANVVTDEAANLDDMLNEMQQKVDEGTIDLEMKSEITVEDGEPEFGGPVGVCYLANSKNNSYPIVITIMENDEIIFQSGMVPIGGRLEKIEFNKKLSAGKHNCIATYSLLDEETQTSRGAASFEVTVNVLQ